MKVIVCLVLVTAVFAGPSKKLNPLSDEFISLINSKQSTWTAGRNFHASMSKEKIRGLVGVIETKQTLPIKQREVGPRVTIPESFDAREAWPECTTIGEIRDQGGCASGWALSAVEVMSDRICIHSNAEKIVSVSAEDLLSCCDICGLGCDGGLLDTPWQYWIEEGIVTGGLYGEKDGCKAYSMEPCSHYVDSVRPACAVLTNTPTCVRACDDNSTSYENELTFGKNDSIYNLPANETEIQLEILENGPVISGFLIYEDFLTYKSGVYQKLEGELVGGHAIKILGWGVEDDTPYWLIANSWNTDWGDNGFFKILRGSNHLSIEMFAIAGLPKL